MKNTILNTIKKANRVALLVQTVAWHFSFYFGFNQGLVVPTK